MSVSANKIGYPSGGCILDPSTTDPGLQDLTIQVFSSGGPLDYSADSDQPWLTVAAETPAVPEGVTLTLSVPSTQDLQRGVQVAIVTLTPVNNTPVQRIAVSLECFPQPSAYFSPNAVSIALSSGQTGSVFGTITPRSDLTTAVDFAIGNPRYLEPNVFGWLQVPSDAPTQVPFDAPINLTLPVSSQTLPVGSYTAYVDIQDSATGDKSTLEVDLTVSAPVPTLVVQPTTLPPFQMALGGTAPSGQNISIKSSIPATPFTVSVMPDGTETWLLLNGTNGPVTVTTPATLNVSVDPAALPAPGLFTGFLTLSGGGGAPVVVAVQVNVTASLALQITPTQLQPFDYAAGGPAPAAQTIHVDTSTGSSVFFTAAPSSSGNWLLVNGGAASQTLSTPADLSVTVAPGNLPPATYTGTISVSTTGSTPVSIPASLVITAADLPAISSGGVVNAASNLPGISAGAFISIYGSNLGSTSRNWAPADLRGDTLPTDLDQTSVQIGGKPAAVSYVSPRQVNAQVPDGIAPGAVDVIVTTPKGSSDPETVELLSYSPAFFTFNGKDAAATHADNTAVGAPGNLTNARPARPGETIVLWATGFGPTNPPTPAGVLVHTANEIPKSSLTVQIGSAPAQVIFAGVTLAGVWQINVVVPELPDGDATLVASMAGTSTPPNVNINIGH